jgi:gentisate 1,2-dioxygenase
MEWREFFNPITDIRNSKEGFMQLIKAIQDHVGSNEEKFYKTTLFRSDALLLGLNCLEPGQIQQPHDHADQDKFYFVVEGEGQFLIGDDLETAVADKARRA